MPEAFAWPEPCAAPEEEEAGAGGGAGAAGGETWIVMFVVITLMGKLIVVRYKARRVPSALCLLMPCILINIFNLLILAAGGSSLGHYRILRAYGKKCRSHVAKK